MIVEKQVFELENFRTESGGEIAQVRIGWESYGTLNAERSNAILITHFFSATSHAAGRYAANDPLPGYWDSIIGPGKPIDTDRYFVLSSDTLVNLNVHDPHVVTTGPASIDPATGEAYGLSFPVISILDFVNVQKALLDKLGIQRLVAIVGPSMGALQAYQWAVSYPERVERIVPVIGAAGGDAFLIAWLDVWAQPIRLDPDWQEGRYHGTGKMPLRGVTAALKTVGMQATHGDWARTAYGRNPANLQADPTKALDNLFAVQAAMEGLSALRAGSVDANTFLYLIKANQLASADASKIRCPVLMVYSPTDLVFPQPWIERTADALRQNGLLHDLVPLTGPNGHLNGVLYIAQAGRQIADFIAKDFSAK